MRIVAGLLASSIALALAACGSSTSTPERASAPPAAATTDPPSPTATTTHGRPFKDGGPPPFVVQYDERELTLHPFVFCYGNGCVDGHDPHPPDLGSPAELRVFVPDPFTELHAGLQERSAPDDEGCEGRVFAAPVEEVGDGWFVVRPGGPAATYELSLSALGGGDMSAALVWHTPVEGPGPAPSATLALIADNDGRPDSFGLDLTVDSLASVPTDAAATIEVTAANGRSMTIEATRAKDSCLGRDTLYFDGPDDQALDAAALGDFPLTTTVTLTLDGVRHTATATYPDDEIEDYEPYVPLEFSPPLAGWAESSSPALPQN
jgi:hypothetical protein